MNYGGSDVDTPSKPWSEWRRKFFWIPKRINNQWYWMESFYVRRRVVVWYHQNAFFTSGGEKYEYEYAKDIFDLMSRFK